MQLADNVMFNLDTSRVMVSSVKNNILEFLVYTENDLYSYFSIERVLENSQNETIWGVRLLDEEITFILKVLWNSGSHWQGP